MLKFKPANIYYAFNALNTNPGKWSNALKQFAANLPMNCLSVFDHFMGLTLKELKYRESS